MKTKIEAAAEAGILTLAHVEGGADFESVADWLSFEPSESDMEDALVAAGLAKLGPVDNELFYRMARERARNAGIIR